MKRDSILTEDLLPLNPELKAAMLARDSDRALAIWYGMEETRNEEWQQTQVKFAALITLLHDHGYHSLWGLWSKWQESNFDDRLVRDDLVRWLLTEDITKLAFHYTEYQHIDDFLEKLILGSEFVEYISSLKLHYFNCIKPPTLSTLDLCLSRYQNLEKLELGDLDLNALGKSITTLSKLTEIDLYGNQLTEFPQQLCQLPRLKKIDLHRNPCMQGRIPLEIANLTQLQALDLGDTIMCDIRHLETLPKLDRLSIEQRWRKSDAPHRIEVFPRSLPALKRITLSSDDLTGMIPALPQSQRLKIEIFGGDSAVDLSLLAQFQNLQSLSIIGTAIVNLNALVNLQNLEVLDLCSNRDVLGNFWLRKYL